jgi:ArsR family transcriptional regulator, arsenate/arsenite/antimonite-responsive transcriptional repressor
MRDLADTFKALSDETRLQMMALLLDNEELCVCDFVGALGLTQSKASRHLRYLYNAGLAKDRRAGVWIHYRLSPDLPPAQRALVDALAQALTEDQRSDLHARLAKWRENRSC